MITPPASLEPVDAHRLPDGQAGWVQALAVRCLQMIQSLSNDERALYAQTWRYLAQYNAPVVARAVGGAGQPSFVSHRLVANLNARRLLWFDDELRAILQCPPFSALHTAHEVKAFGWERAYACSFVDIPLTLLVYGPNVWLEASSRCRRSGERLDFRVRMDEYHRLQLDAPLNHWRVWLPLPDPPIQEDPYAQFHDLRSKIHPFHTQADLDTHRQYQDGPPGVVYTLEQAIYLGECLLKAYRYATD